MYFRSSRTGRGDAFARALPRKQEKHWQKKEEEEKKEIKAIRKTEEERSVRRRGKRKRVKSFKCMQGDVETDRQTLVLHSALPRD